MTIEELKNKHSELIEVGLGNTEEELAEYWFNKQKEHTELSIQFAIEILEEIEICNSLGELPDIIEDKIQELKQYLDEKV